MMNVVRKTNFVAEAESFPSVTVDHLHIVEWNELAYAEIGLSDSLSSPTSSATRTTLDGVTMPQLESEVMRQLKYAGEGVVLDLDHVTLLTGSGVHRLLSLAHHADRIGCIFALCNIHPSVHAMIKKTGLDHFIPVYTNEFEAMAHLGGGRVAG